MCVSRGKYFIGRKVFGDWDIRVEQVGVFSMSDMFFVYLLFC